VDVKTLARFQADAWSYSLYCVVAAAVGAVLWRLAEIGARFKAKGVMWRVGIRQAHSRPARVRSAMWLLCRTPNMIPIIKYRSPIV
jgi:hypothetical protein